MLVTAIGVGYSVARQICCNATERARVMRTLMDTAVLDGTALAGPGLAALLLLLVVILISPLQGAAMEKAR